MTVFVISKYGQRLMPTTRCGKVRHMLKDGRAVIVSRNPFTIQLTYETTAYTQPMELCLDTGYGYIGVSVKSERREYVSAEYDLPMTEKKHHDEQRKYRRQRRSRKRHKAPRFDNRRASKKEGWLAPSIEHKEDAHIHIAQRYVAAVPITSITVEVGQFDPAKLKAIEEGKAIPEGKDYQHGPKYLLETIRQAVFQRDHYKCRFCGRGIADGAILHAHHYLYWKGIHGNRVSEQAAACEICHTPANHQFGALLWGQELEKVAFLEGATFMNTVRWYIVDELKELGVPVNVTYGAETAATRKFLGLEKSHVNDAYCMGMFRPAERAETVIYEKRCRNNRCLEKFYDAKIYDIRDGKPKSGNELGCERTNRREPRNSKKSLRKYRGPKKSKGRRTVRTQRYSIRPGTVFVYRSQSYVSKGVQHYGQFVTAEGLKKAAAVKNITIVSQPGGWTITRKEVNGAFTPA